MSKYIINNYISNSEFASLRNDQSGVLELPIIGGFSVAPGASRLLSVEARIGTKNAPVRVLMKSSKNNKWQPCTCLDISIDNVSTDGVIINYPTVAYIERISPETIRLSCVIFNNNYQGQMHIGLNDQVITAKIHTFKSPFER